jgi:glycosyltransferase involved in cell wall biosynthesis
MKISVFTTCSNPIERQDPFVEAIENYLDLADEVVIVDGSGKFPNDEFFIKNNNKGFIKTINYKWEEEFDWTFIGEQFQRGYDACTGDWVIRADLDYFFHDDDLVDIRTFLEDIDSPAVVMPKRQLMLANRSRVKSLVPLAYNKGKYGNRIKLNSGGDLCQPSLDGKELKVDELPIISRREYVIVNENVSHKQLAKRLPNPQSKDGNVFVQVRGITFWNYDFTFKTEDIIRKDFSRFSRAWNRTFGNWCLGGPSEDESFQFFLNMMVGRFNSNPCDYTSLEQHPKYIQQRIKNIKPEQFGYDMFGKVKR